MQAQDGTDANRTGSNTAASENEWWETWTDKDATDNDTTTTVWSSDTAFDDVLLDLTYLLQAWLKFLYLVLRPLLVLAGTAMDNSLVYGEFFDLDRPLWQLRNMSKNFANFALWFFVLYQILQFIFSVDKTEFEIKKILWWALLAWVGIQLSWFVIWALVDVSTIATYGIWWMPLTLLDETTLWDKVVLSVHSQVKFVDFAKDLENFDKHSTYYSFWKKNIAACHVYRSHILWPVLYSGGDLSTVAFDDNYCVMWMNRVIYLKPFYDAIKPLYEKEWYDSPNNKDFRFNFLEYGVDSKFANLNQQFVDNNYNYIPNLLLKDGEAETPWQKAYLEWAKTAEKQLREEEPWGILLKDVIESWWWFVWPLVTLYSTLLDFAQVDDVDYGWVQKWNFRQFMEFALKAGIAIMLIAPLIALCLILIVRIWYMRLYIAFSPFIALIWWFNALWNDIWWEKWKEMFSFSKVVWVIFAPVLPVLALWLSIIFLQTTLNWFNMSEPWKVRDAFGVTIWPGVDANGKEDQTQTCIDMMWLTEMCYENEWMWTGWNSFTDFFGRLVINIFAIAVVWMIMFTALKSSDFGKSIAKSVENTGKSILWDIPLVPVPWMWKDGWRWWVWANTLSEGLWRIPQQIQNNSSRRQNEDISKFMNKMYGEQAFTATKWKEAAQEIESLANSEYKWQTDNINQEDFYRKIMDKAWVKYNSQQHTFAQKDFVDKTYESINMKFINANSSGLWSQILWDFDTTVNGLVTWKWDKMESTDANIETLNKYFWSDLGKEYLSDNNKTRTFKPGTNSIKVGEETTYKLIEWKLQETTVS